MYLDRVSIAEFVRLYVPLYAVQKTTTEKSSDCYQLLFASVRIAMTYVMSEALKRTPGLEL